jgi:hypothetical protein
MKPILISLALYFLICFTTHAQHSGLSGLPLIRNYTFNSIEKKVLPGKSTEKAENGAVQSTDIIGNLALVSLFYQNSCYTDGRYNHNDFPVEKGEISGHSGSLKYEAYRVYAPTHMATEFLASKHNIYYQFPSKQDYCVYQFEGNDFKKIAEIPANSIKVGGFTKIDNLIVSDLTGHSTFVFIPKNTDLNVYSKLNETVEAAKINQVEFGEIYKIRYSVKGAPFDNLANYADKMRHFFPVNLDGEKTAIVWQDMTDMSVHSTIINENLVTHSTLDLPNRNNGILAAATANKQGELFYFTIFEKKGSPVNAVLCKTNSKTSVHTYNQLDASKQLDMYAYGNETASMAVYGNKVLLMFGRKMNKSNDGLNHQGGIAVSFDAANLSLIKNYGQTSGHSFDNFLGVNSTGEFVGMDLGDNYPRGINLHRFNESMSSKVVYTFKTKHGETADCWGLKSYPVYPEISSSTKKYYKWSNDNNTYTELGAVIETSDGYLVSFLGEPDKNGYALKNTGFDSKCARNVGFVKVNKNFDNGSNDIFLSKGITETGGYYTFGGSWSEQKNTGLVWLTTYTSPDVETAKNLKTVKLNDGNLLFLWEKWANDAYSKTLALKTNPDGKPIGNVVDLGSLVRLDRRNDLLVKGNQVILISGNKNEQKLELCILNIH